MNINAALLIAGLIGAVPSHGAPPLPSGVRERCERERAAERDPADKPLAYLLCVFREEDRIKSPGYVPTPEEASWVAARRQYSADEREWREQWRKLVGWGYLVATIVAGTWLAWRAGRAASFGMRWGPIGVYLCASASIFLLITHYMDDGRVARDVWPDVVAHAHWAIVLALIVHRRWIRDAVRGGWGRLYVVASLVWVTWFAIEFAQSDHYDEDILRFTSLGLLAPALLCLAIRWVARGFQAPSIGSGQE